MKSFVESLESRTLLSVAPAVGELKAEDSLIKSDLVVFGKLGVDNFKLIYSDMKTAGTLKANKVLLTRLAIESTSGFALTTRAIKSTETVITSALNKVLAAAKVFAKHPTASAMTKLTAAESTFSLDASNKLTVIDNDISAEHTTNLTNLTSITSANTSDTQLVNDINNTIEPRTTAARTTLLGDVSTALSTDVPAVVAAYPT